MTLFKAVLIDSKLIIHALMGEVAVPPCQDDCVTRQTLEIDIKLQGITFS